MVVLFENLQTKLSRGRRSRNKVSVGEPAEGSFTPINHSSRIDLRVYSMLPSGDNPDCLTFVIQSIFLKKKKKMKILNGGYLGSHTDEERSELR